MNFKGILLDLDDTIYDYAFAHEKALDVTFQYISDILNETQEDVETMFLKAKESVKLELSGTGSSHNRALYFQRLFDYFKVNAQLYTLETYECYWSTFLDFMNCYSGAREFLELTKEIPICIVTDLTTHIQHRKIEKLGIQNKINFMVSSEEAGKEKPHPYIFMKALEKLGLESDEVIMIGDNYKKDVIGASSLGIKTFWINHHQKNIPDSREGVLVVSDFLQLKETLSYVYQ